MSISESSDQSAPLIVFGEVLFDNFPDGRRILGGAPFNVAWSLKGFGRDPLFISAVGADSEGREIRGKMEEWDLSSAGLQEDMAHATGEVRVTINNDEPSYEICPDRAWDYIQDTDWTGSGIIYHGLLALRHEVSRQSLRQIIERSNAQRFFDVNLRPPFVDWSLLKSWMQGTDWLKLNIDELRTILETPDIVFQDAVEHLDGLRSQYSIKNVVLTGGSKGAILHGDYGTASCMPAPTPDPFVDTVGAGDAFSASTLHGILDNQPVTGMAVRASQFAAKVCGMRGATTLNKTFYQ